MSYESMLGFLTVKQDWYDARVLALELEGLSRSDAQAVVDAEDLRHELAQLDSPAPVPLFF
jgi:hypothetical protein